MWLANDIVSHAVYETSDEAMRAARDFVDSILDND